MGIGHFNVAPRYTPGSPALVNERIAIKVATEERHFIEHALEGAWGEAQAERARKLGLRGIVEWRFERGSGKKHGWEVIDLLTGEKFFRLCDEALRASGWRAFADLESWEKDLVKPRYVDEPDYEKGYYQIDAIGRILPDWRIRRYRAELLNTGIWPWPALQPEAPPPALALIDLGDDHA